MNRCEYCLLAQAGQEATFHVDHVTPRVAGGPTIDGNLALACVGCSLRKGAAEALAMNRPLVVAIREEQALLGRSAADDTDPQ